MKTVLITGFEPFGGESVNPSWEVVSGLDNAIIAGCRVVARQLPCEIISIDSALVFRDMDIGTAKPSLAEREVCPHHLIDLIDPTEAYSAAQFRADAIRLIKEIRARGRLPLLVGGTLGLLPANL